MMGRRLARRGFEAELLLCSPATRAVATAEIIAEEISYPVDEIVVDDRLYGAGLHTLIEVITGLDDSLDSVVLLGHNPGMSDLVDTISPNLVGSLPTCGIVRFELDVASWTQAMDATALEAEYDFPRLARWS
jgi:phosphohistidine phosphatase